MPLQFNFNGCFNSFLSLIESVVYFIWLLDSYLALFTSRRYNGVGDEQAHVMGKVEHGDRDPGQELHFSQVVAVNNGDQNTGKIQIKQGRNLTTTTV